MEKVKIYPISEIEPVFKRGMRIYQKHKDVVITRKEDVEGESKVLIQIVTKMDELPLGLILLMLDIIKEHKPEIASDYSECAKYISSKLKTACSHSQIKEAIMSKFFKRKAKHKHKSAKNER